MKVLVVGAGGQLGSELMRARWAPPIEVRGVDLPAFDLTDRAEVSRTVTEHQPAVIVYDVSIPYEQNWRLFEHFRDSPACRGVVFVVTTTNVQQLRKVAGPGPELHEIIGKPYDLDAVVSSVRGCLRQSGQAREDSAEGLRH